MSFPLSANFRQTENPLLLNGFTVFYINILQMLMALQALSERHFLGKGEEKV